MRELLPEEIRKIDDRDCDLDVFTMGKLCSDKTELLYHVEQLMNGYMESHDQEFGSD